MLVDTKRVPKTLTTDGSLVEHFYTKPPTPLSKTYEIVILCAEGRRWVMVLGFQGFEFCSISTYQGFSWLHINRPVNQIDYTKVLLLPAPTLGGMDFVPED